jgi:hypothetical protein
MKTEKEGIQLLKIGVIPNQKQNDLSRLKELDLIVVRPDFGSERQTNAFGVITVIVEMNEIKGATTITFLCDKDETNNWLKEYARCQKITVAEACLHLVSKYLHLPSSRGKSKRFDVVFDSLFCKTTI